MAQPVTNSDRITSQTIAAALLNSMVDVTEATPVARQSEQVQFHTGSGYQSYREMGRKAILKPDHLQQIRIAVGDSAPCYFRKIANIGARGEKTETGFKAIAWVETGADGEPLVAEGRAHMVLAFPGYKGNPYDKKPATLSMHAIGRGELYPPAREVAAFVREARRALAAINPAMIPEVDIVAHSVGGSNIIPAALACEEQGMPVKQVLALDPVGAKLAERLVREALVAKAEGKANRLMPNAQALVAQFHFDPKEGQAKIDGIVAKTSTVTPVKFDRDRKIHSRSAMLASYDYTGHLEAHHELRERGAGEYQLRMHRDRMEREQWRFRKKNFDAILKGTRDGGMRDPGNSPIGTAYEVDMTDRVADSYPFPFAVTAAMADPMHLLPNLLGALERGAHISEAHHHESGYPAGARQTGRSR